MVDPRDYTIGWICAIPTGFAAATAFFDDNHSLPALDGADPNSYEVGKMGEHNVVIATLPNNEYGTNSAAIVATHMVRTFRNIRIGLMVGIGGGVPSSKNDVRLCDIVVSTSESGQPAVLQYDYGKTIQEQNFKRTGFLDQPPPAVRGALASLKAQYKKKRPDFNVAVSDILAKYPDMVTEYVRPDEDTDMLYESNFVHGANWKESDAQTVKTDKLKRTRRATQKDKQPEPVIHEGMIASANQLMKDAHIRDKLSEEMNVLCFEMEAAGLMNAFKCLVIRGICDYSDSHKNKQWQGYAAMVAAAYAKDLLRRVAPTAVSNTDSIVSDLSQVVRGMNETLDELHRQFGDEQSRANIKTLLSPVHMSLTLENVLEERRLTGSGHWLLDDDIFASWTCAGRSFLWLHGRLGCGKTVLSSAIIQHLQQSKGSRNVLYFFFSQTGSLGAGMLNSMVNTIIWQLSHSSEARWRLMASATKKQESQPMGSRDAHMILLEMLREDGDIYLVLDALDECFERGDEDGRGILPWLKNMHSSGLHNLHILVTSRSEDDILRFMQDFLPHDNIVQLQDATISADIRRYVRARLEDFDFRTWRLHPDLQDTIVSQVTNKSNGM